MSLPENSLERQLLTNLQEFHIKEEHFQQYHFPFQSQIEFIMFLTTTMHIFSRVLLTFLRAGSTDSFVSAIRAPNRLSI